MVSFIFVKYVFYGLYCFFDEINKLCLSWILCCVNKFVLFIELSKFIVRILRFVIRYKFFWYFMM